MAGKRFLAQAALFLWLAAIGAQTSAPPEGGAATESEAAPAAYYTLGENGQPVFTQVLRWDADPNALEYQVIVRDASDAVFLDERTPDATKELHLPPGAYTYKIVTYNLLGKPDIETDWVGITIIKAEQPKLAAASPGSIYMDSLDGRITVTGDKLLPDGVIALVPSNGKARSEGKVVERKEDKEIIVAFPDKAYEPGDYSLSFTNPGGLHAVLDPALRIRFQRPVDLLVSLGYSPFVSLGDDWATGAWPGSFKPLGFEASIGLFFVKQQWGFLGLEAEARWRKMYGGDSKATLASDFVLAGADFLYKYRFTRQLHGLARLGGGLSWNYHAFDYEGFAGPTAASWDPFAQAGLALQAFLPLKLYGEIGADCLCIFLIGHYSIGIAPRLLVGYQLF